MILSSYSSGKLSSGWYEFENFSDGTLIPFPLGVYTENNPLKIEVTDGFYYHVFQNSSGNIRFGASIDGTGRLTDSNGNSSLRTFSDSSYYLALTVVDDLPVVVVKVVDSGKAKYYGYGAALWLRDFWSALQASSFSPSAAGVDVEEDNTKNPPDITGEDAKPTVTVTDANAATIEELLRQILEKMESNTLATDIAVDGTQTGDNTGDKTDEDAKPYLPYIPQIFEKIKDLPGTLSNIWETIKGLPAAIAEKIGAFFTTLWGWLQKVIDAIVSIPATVAEKVGELFKPDEALVTEITDAFKGKFGFLPTLKRFGDDLFGMTAETEPPVIWVHFENAESKYGYDYGGKEKMLDLSWYQKYKANVDTLISGFLWLGFLWLLFKRTAAIIQGGEMLAEYSHDFSQGRRDSNETKFQRYLWKD